VANFKSFDMSTNDDLISAMQVICSSMNIGLMVHHIEDFENVEFIQFIYANPEASKYTGTDLSALVGKSLPEAFPELTKTDVPEVFLEVARTKEARNIGVMEYEDKNVKQANFAVKAFPLPNDCVGVAFENVTHRKQLEGMIKDYTDKLRIKNAQLEKLASTIYNEVAVPLGKIQRKGEELKDRCQKLLQKKDAEYLDEIIERSGNLMQFVEQQISMARSRKLKE